jgi:hypothetical protein
LFVVDPRILQVLFCCCSVVHVVIQLLLLMHLHYPFYFIVDIVVVALFWVHYLLLFVPLFVAFRC